MKDRWEVEKDWTEWNKDWVNEWINEWKQANKRGWKEKKTMITHKTDRKRYQEIKW